VKFQRQKTIQIASLFVCALFLTKLRQYIIEINPPYFSPVKISKVYFEKFTFLEYDLPRNTELTTLSASSSRIINLYFAIFVSLVTSIYFLLRQKITKKEFYFLLPITIFGNIFLLLQIDDLVDEAYVWIEKIENLVSFGRLGVNLYDGSFAESSVGTLHFILATIPKLLGFTAEQSLFVPLYLTFTISQILIFKLIVKHTLSYLSAILFVLVVYVSPVIGLNFSNAFDNILAFSALIYWLSFEINLHNSPEKLRRSRLLFIFVFPLIRLDYFIISCGLLFLHVIDNQLFSLERIRREFHENIKHYYFLLVAFIVWISYKFWAFGDLIPAMAKFKGFHLDAYLWKTGAIELYRVLNLESFIRFGAILIIPIFLTLSFSQKTNATRVLEHLNFRPGLSLTLDSKLKILLFLNTFYLAANFALTIISGGDYFGVGYARYQFPFLLVELLLLILLLKSFIKFDDKSMISSNMIVLNLFSAFCLLVGLILFRPEEFQKMRLDLQTVDAGRATCDNAAALAVAELFPKIQTVASPELNGFGYHAKLDLVDLVGLVDANASHDNYIGTSGAKFRILPSDKALNATDIVWLFPASECTLDASWVSDLGEVNSDKTYRARRLSELVNSWAGTLRIINFNQYIDRGLKPYAIYFRFTVEGITHYGQTYIFVKP
jgi:hypothetical protein